MGVRRLPSKILGWAPPTLLNSWVGGAALRFERYENFEKIENFEKFEKFIVRMADFKLGLADLKLVSYPKGLKSIKSKLGWPSLS